MSTRAERTPCVSILHLERIPDALIITRTKSALPDADARGVHSIKV